MCTKVDCWLFFFAKNVLKILCMGPHTHTHTHKSIESSSLSSSDTVREDRTINGYEVAECYLTNRATIATWLNSFAPQGR